MDVRADRGPRGNGFDQLASTTARGEGPATAVSRPLCRYVQGRVSSSPALDRRLPRPARHSAGGLPSTASPALSRRRTAARDTSPGELAVHRAGHLRRAGVSPCRHSDRAPIRSTEPSTATISPWWPAAPPGPPPRPWNPAAHRARSGAPASLRGVAPVGERLRTGSTRPAPPPRAAPNGQPEHRQRAEGPHPGRHRLRLATWRTAALYSAPCGLT